MILAIGLSLAVDCAWQKNANKEPDLSRNVEINTGDMHKQLGILNAFGYGMTYREAIKYKMWSNSAPGTTFLAEIIAWVCNTVKNQFPMGYQDENGFHFGEEPAKKS